MSMPKKLVEDLHAALDRVSKEDPKVLFQRLVDSGLITTEGRLTNRYRGPGKYVRYTIEEEDEMRRSGELTIADGE